MCPCVCVCVVLIYPPDRIQTIKRSVYLPFQLIPRVSEGQRSSSYRPNSRPITFLGITYPISINRDMTSSTRRNPIQGTQAARLVNSRSRPRGARRNELDKGVMEIRKKKRVGRKREGVAERGKVRAQSKDKGKKTQGRKKSGACWVG